MGFKKFYIALICLAVVLCATASNTPMQDNGVSEYQVKAVFLFNFTQFIEWSETSFQDGNSPFVVGILGEDPFGKYLKEAIEGETYRNRPFIIKHLKNADEINDCQILFISGIEREKLRRIITAIDHKSILTISDIQGFANDGGIIEFTKNNNKIKLKINQLSAKKAQLDISSKLLRLAEIVSPGNEK